MRTILFDLDGTLVDQFESIHRAYAHVMEELGLPPADYATVRRTVGGSMEVTMGKLVGPDLAARGIELYLPYFERIMLEGLRALPWAHEILQALHELGHRLAVFTNKRNSYARTACEHLKLDEYLELIAGEGDTPWRKPQRKFTQWVLGQLDTTAEESLMIGDSPYDVDSALCVDMPCRLVATGTHTPEELTSTEAASVHSDLADLARVAFDIELTNSVPLSK